MFSLLQSQNTLEKVPITITLPSSNIIYTGNAIDLSIETNNSKAVYGIKVNGDTMAKMSNGNDMINTSSVLELGFDVGSNISYTIEPLGDENYNYVFDGKSNLTGTFTIVPATLNLTAAVTSFTYSGASQSLSFSVTGTGVDTGYLVSNTSGTNAESYTATLTKSSNNYVLGTTTSIPWTISKAILTITSSNASMTYGSSMPNFSSTISGFLGSDLSVTPTISGSVTFSTTGSSIANIATYSIVPNIASLGATNYTFTPVNGILTINPATLNLSGAANQSFIYNGASQNLSYSVTGTGADTGYLVSNTSGTNAESYTATLTKSSNNYVLGTTTSIPWTISKAILTITSSNASMTYGSSMPNFSSTISGFLGSDLSVTPTISGSVTFSTTGSSTANVATYAIVPNVSGLSATNYTFTTSNGTLTINAATLNLSGAASQSFIYNGANQGLSFSVTGAVASDTGYLVSNTSTTNAGSYTATLTKSSNNYVLGATTTIPWTISKAALTITAVNTSMTYGSALPTFSSTISGFKGSETSSVITGSVTHSTTGSSTANVSTYAIIPNLSGLSATNYTFTAANGTLTINAATLNLSGAASQSFIYNGSSRGLSYSVTGAVASDAGYLVLNTSNINVGPYTATLTKSSNNYVLGATTTIPWSITPAALTTSTISASVPYNGSSQQVFVFGTVNGTSSGGTATGTNAGTYSATITGIGNYSGSISGNLFITKISGGVTFKPTPYGDIAPGDNSVISFSSYVASQTGPISFSASASGPGSGDAIITSTSVQNNNSTTAGFVVTIVASAGDKTNYVDFSSTITLTFYAYVAPPPPVGQQE